MKTKIVKPSEIKVGNEIVFDSRNGGQVTCEVDRIYNMVQNGKQVRFKKGGPYAAATFYETDQVLIVA